MSPSSWEVLLIWIDRFDVGSACFDIRDLLWRWNELNLSSPRQARALSIKPGRAQACLNVPGAWSFNPELFAYKRDEIWAWAYFELFCKLGWSSLEPGDYFTVRPKFGPGLWAQAQARSTSNLLGFKIICFSDALTTSKVRLLSSHLRRKLRIERSNERWIN